jgi:hypothetical protein
VNSKLRKTSVVLAALILVGVLLQPFGGGTAAGSDGQGKSDLTGVWRVTITPRNCDTGMPIPIAAFEALFTFHKGGTMSVWVPWTVGATMVTMRSPVHGLWRREHGRNDYAFKIVHLRYNLATGVFLGRQESSAILELGENGNEFATDSSTVVFDATGTAVAQSCANSVGIRFEIDQ